jgi:hypothetical protein
MTTPVAEFSTASLGEAPARKPRKPRTHHMRTHEQLERAESLRPSEVRLLHGIPPSTLHAYMHLPAEIRLPSVKIRGIKGSRGMTLVDRVTLKAWLRWQEWRGMEVDAKVQASPEFRDFRVWLQSADGKAAVAASR